MRLDGRYPRLRTVDRVAGGVELHEPVGLAPVERRPDVAAYAPGGFRLRAPDGCLDGQDIFALDPVHGHVGEALERIPFQLLHPVGRDLLVAPAGAQRVVSVFGRLAERRHLGLAVLGQGIAAAPGQHPILGGVFARLCVRDATAAAEPDVVALTVRSVLLRESDVGSDG